MSLFEIAVERQQASVLLMFVLRVEPSDMICVEIGVSVWDTNTQLLD
jgi:hypothetical protein